MSGSFYSENWFLKSNDVQINGDKITIICDELNIKTSNGIIINLIETILYLKKEVLKSKIDKYFIPDIRNIILFYL